MRRLLGFGTLFVLVGLGLSTGIGTAQDPATPTPLGDFATYDDDAETVTFTIRFDGDPSAALLESDGFRARLSFGYFAFTDGDTGGGPIDSELVIAGRTILDTGQVLVQDTQPLGTGPGGWGPQRGTIGYSVTPVGDEFHLSFTTSYELLGDDGRLAYDLVVTEFGARIFASLGSSTPTTPSAAVGVTPRGELVGGQDVSIELSGFAPSSSVEWFACFLTGGSAENLDCGDPLGSTSTDAAGAVAPFDQRIERWLYTDADESFDDCARSSDPCVIAAIDAEGTTAWSPLNIVDPGSITAGTVIIDAERVTADGQLIDIIGSGYRPGAIVEVRQCRANPRTPGDCNGAHPGAVAVADTDGNFSTTVAARRFVAPEPGTESTDCFDGSVSCVIAASDARDFADTLATAPLIGPIQPVIIPGGARISEGTGGTTTMRLPVTLSEPTTVPVTADWRTVEDPTWSDLAATLGVDYQFAQGQVSFAPGETVRYIELTINSDGVAEGNELLVVSLFAPDGGRLGGYLGLLFGGITDDDGPLL